MTIAEHLASRDLVAGPTGTGRPCKFATVRARLDPADDEALDNALQDGVSSELLAAVLTRGGHPISERTIARHRRGVCPCPAPANDREAAA